MSLTLDKISRIAKAAVLSAAITVLNGMLYKNENSGKESLIRARLSSYTMI